MTGEEFAAVFDEARHSAFRLETLPAYDVGDEEAERIAAWRCGRPRPLRSVATDMFLAEVAATTLTGRRWDRVRVLDDPPTDYQRFQLVGYVETQAAGDHVWTVRREVLDPDEDFWLFDSGLATAQAVGMGYTQASRPESYRHITGGSELAELETLRITALEVARPLNEYLADPMAVRAN